MIQNEMRRKDRIMIIKTLWNKSKVVPTLSILSQMCMEGCTGKAPYILPVTLDGNELSNYIMGESALVTY
jgi:hypothetical protein